MGADPIAPLALADRFFPYPLLAIESSCDETAVAVLRGLEIRCNLISSQIDLHAATGGVVPEVAARAHVESIIPIIDQALESCELQLSEVRGIAVANRPGLIGSLSVGVTAAKALAFGLGVSIIGVHHLEGHLLSPLATEPSIEFPHVCLLVSGGHTELVHVQRLGDYAILGRTLDDAAGEAFDKSARLLGFPYPGGRALSEAAKSGDPKRYALPRGLEGKHTLDFSFSGLKTAVRRLLETSGDSISAQDLAASVEEAITSVLESRALEAMHQTGSTTLTLSGGVAANSKLRERLKAACLRNGFKFVPAPSELCTDNAAMIGIAGSWRLQSGQHDGFELECMANSPLPGVEK